MKTFVVGILLSSLYVVANAQNRTNTYKKDVLIWYKAFNENAPTLLDGVLDKRWEDIPAAPGAPTGPEGVKRMLVELITTFPDFKVQVKDVLQDGNKVIVRSEITGTQKGTFLGTASKSRSFSIQAVDIHEFKDGKIIRTWHTEDWMTGLRQLGILAN
jgi:steroid delta-isomerase-like uncharacterized protein